MTVHPYTSKSDLNVNYMYSSGESPASCKLLNAVIEILYETYFYV